MATNPKQGAGIEIKPFVNEAEAAKAMARLTRLAEEANKAAEKGNAKRFASLSQRISAQLGKPHELKIQTKVVFDNATQSFKQIKTMAAGAMDPLLKASKQADRIQGQGVKKLAKIIELERQKARIIKTTLNTQRLSTQERKKQTAELAKSLALQKQLAEAKPVVTTKTSMQGQLREAAQLRDSINRVDVAVDKYGKRVYKLNPAWVAQNKKVQGLQRGLKVAEFQAAGFGGKVQMLGKGMQAAFGWITAAVATLAALGGAIGAITGRVKDVQALRLTFDGLGQSVEAQNAILASSRNIALSYGVSLRKVEGAFRRLGPAILESGGTLKDTEGAIKSIAARTTMLGLNTEQTGRYIEAFAQVMGKGKLQSEELNQQFSELDGGLRGQLKNWLAINKGITDFEGAMKRGEITSGVFLEAFEAINEEIRNKFLRSIGDTQTAIDSLGEKGGLTLNQLNAKLGTLTSIGMEGLAKAVAPIGKELMKVYAAFIQVFTKIAAEMPGITALFRGVGHILGVVIKVALNTVILGFGVLAQAIDVVIQAVIQLYNWIKKIPLIGDFFKGLEGIGAALNKNFDTAVDGFSRLSDETVGAKAELEKYNDEMAMLKKQQLENEITQEEYHKKVKELQAGQTEDVRKQAQQELEIEKEKLQEMLDAKKKQLDRENQLAQRKIASINKAKDREVKAIDETISDLGKQKNVIKDVYDSKIEKVKSAYQVSKRAIEDELTALRQQKTAVQQSYRTRMDAAKEHYSKLKAEMDAAHSREMSHLDKKIAKLKASHSAQMSALSSGPQQQVLNEMKITDLRRQAAQETNALKKQEILAEIERMENAGRRARLEEEHAKKMARLQAEKAKVEKKQAEEKKKLDQEEKQRQKEMETARQTALDNIQIAVERLAGIKRQDAKDEKDEVDALKKKKKDAMDEMDKRIEQQKAKRTDANKQAEEEIMQIKEAIELEREAVEDVEYAMNQQITAQQNVGAAVDSVTNGALQRQLQKVLTIKKTMEGIGSNSGSAPGSGRLSARASGGPVTGGSTYTVNELGKEGFLSASGKLSQINVPAWGTWKAPGSGTVIPAHIWKNIKSGQQGKINIPRNTNPGNATARAISTINNSTGSQYNNSVTIQSTNPVQAANNVMVQLTKLKRLRYS